MECEDNLRQVKEYYSGNNCVVTGSPTFDLFASMVATGKDWKLEDGKLKKVIWAPHHTIQEHPDMIRFSTFYCIVNSCWGWQKNTKINFNMHLSPILIAPCIIFTSGLGERGNGCLL